MGKPSTAMATTVFDEILTCPPDWDGNNEASDHSKLYKSTPANNPRRTDKSEVDKEPLADKKSETAVGLGASSEPQADEDRHVEEEASSSKEAAESSEDGGSVNQVERSETDLGDLESVVSRVSRVFRQLQDLDAENKRRSRHRGNANTQFGGQGMRGNHNRNQRGGKSDFPEEEDRRRSTNEVLMDEDESVASLVGEAILQLGQIRARLMRVAAQRIDNDQDLLALQTEDSPEQDLSVQFFGLDWSSVFSQCFKLGMELRLLNAGLEQDRLHYGRLVSAIAILNQLEAETRLHAESLTSGRLRLNDTTQLEMLYREQQRIAANSASKPRRTQRKYSLAVPATGFLFDNGAKKNAESGARQPTKYRGSKTDSALGGHSSGRRASAVHKVDVSSSSSPPLPNSTVKQRRKSSLIENLANLFRS